MRDRENVTSRRKMSVRGRVWRIEVSLGLAALPTRYQSLTAGTVRKCQRR
jgi:hypothetical protein